MKDSFNIASSDQGALCSLCQDRLLRHIRKSRMFWYCPSCRQETVCEEQASDTPEKDEIAPPLQQTEPYHPLANVIDPNVVSMLASASHSSEHDA